MCAASESAVMYMCTGACRGQKREFRDLPELELQAVVNLLTWVLGPGRQCTLLTLRLSQLLVKVTKTGLFKAVFFSYSSVGWIPNPGAG